MAKGRIASRFETGLGFFGLIAIGVTLAIVFQWNPWPRIQAWLKERGTGAIATPATAWTQRAAGQPDAAAVTDRAVLVMMGDMVEAHARTDGALLWRKEADWAALAGAGATAVAVVSKVDGRGFDAVDPHSGEVRWTDTDAIGAWTFRDAVLTIACPKAGCAIVNRAPADGAVRSRTALAGAVRALGGANSGLLDLRDPAGPVRDAKPADPRPLPRYLGFLIDHRVQVIDTTAARRVREEEVPNDARTVVAGNRTVRTTAAPKAGGCRFTVTARDAASGRALWQRDGYDPGTAGGAGCEPRRDPVGGATAMITTRGDNRQVLLSTVDGRELAVAGPDETIEGTDGELGIIRTADDKQLRAVDLTRGGATAWTRAVAPKSRVGLTPYGVFVTDAATERVTVVDRTTGQLRLDLVTGAIVLGIHADGVVLGRGRTIGWAAFTAAG